MTDTLTQVLGHFIATFVNDAIPPLVITRAKVSLIHNAAVAMAGRSRESVAAAIAKHCWPVPAEATLLTDGTRASMEAAALANGALIHARSQDDTHAGSTSHPGGAVLPAALAVGEVQGRSGADFLAAVCLGYEVLARVGRDVDEAVTAQGFRCAAVFGGFGAAAAAARLLALSSAQTTHALGLAAHLAGGLAQVWREGSAEGPLQLGFAARNGILAARAAEVGATAAAQILEGPGGFYRAYAGSREATRAALDGLGDAWQLPEVTVKAYPVCAILQGPVDSMLRLARSGALAGDAAVDITLELSPYEARYPGIDNPGPYVSAIATKLSAPYCMALAWLRRRLTMDDLFRFSDADVASLASRVRVVADPTRPSRSSRLTVRRGGMAIVDTVTTPVGCPSLDESAAFARSLAPEMGVDVAIVDRMIEAVLTLERAPRLDALLASLVAQAGDPSPVSPAGTQRRQGRKR